MNLTLLFKGLSDPVRLRIVHLLIQREPLCVCHLTDALALPQSTVSRHLNALKNFGLVEAERKGTWMHYCMKQAPHIHELSEIVKREALDDAQLQKDLARLQQTQC